MYINDKKNDKLKNITFLVTRSDTLGGVQHVLDLQKNLTRTVLDVNYNWR